MYKAKLDERAGLIAKQEAILNTIMDEKRNMTVDEKASFDKLDIAIGECEEIIERAKNLHNRENYSDLIPPQTNNSVPQPKIDNSKPGFDHMGEFFQAVARANSDVGRFQGAGTIDQRLMNAAAGHSATVPSDGGFLIGSTKSNEIMQKIYTGGEILSRCASYEVGEYSDSFEVPYVDETSRVSGSRWGGLRAYREGEVDTPTSSKTKMGKWECRLTDIKALVYITERMLQDAPALESLIMAQMPQEFIFKLEDEILNGEGGAQCKGIVGDTATVNITKETGQAMDTILAENIIKMYARCWGRSRGKAAWFHNQDVETQLFAMTFSVGTGGVPIFMPANGLSTSPFNTLFGKPLIPTEQCATVGTEGDIILADFNEYALVKKGGLNAASSIHVKFLTDEMAFKFNMRVNGKPKWNNKLTPYKGSNSLSPFVTLDDRD